MRGSGAHRRGRGFRGLGWSMTAAGATSKASGHWGLAHVKPTPNREPCLQQPPWGLMSKHQPTFSAEESLLDAEMAG